MTESLLLLHIISLIDMCCTLLVDWILYRVNAAHSLKIRGSWSYIFYVYIASQPQFFIRALQYKDVNLDQL